MIKIVLSFERMAPSRYYNSLQSVAISVYGRLNSVTFENSSVEISALINLLLIAELDSQPIKKSDLIIYIEVKC